MIGGSTTIRPFAALIVLSCVTAALGVPQAAAQTAAEMNATLDTLFGEHERFEVFLTDLQQSVVDDDEAGLAGMISYPISVNIDGTSTSIADEAEFASNFDDIVTADVKDAVASQNYENLFANWQGIMIGDGEVWFSMVDNAVKIITINN